MKFLSFLAAVLFSFSVAAQDILPDDTMDAMVIDTSLRADISVGLEFQAYPTGFIPGFIIDATFNNANALILRLGYNWFNHRNLGVHDSEKGSGFGFSLGYRRYFEEQGLKGFFIGLRTDWWFNSVDWSEHENDDRSQAILLESTSDIIVFQPTFETGYRIYFKNRKAAFTPMIALGYEANISTQGEIIPPLDYPDNVNTSADTGEGIIVLAGISFTFIISRDDY
jgi:hypothetical protein